MRDLIFVDSGKRKDIHVSFVLIYNEIIVIIFSEIILFVSVETQEAKKLLNEYNEP